MTVFKEARKADIQNVLAMMEDFYAIDGYPFDVSLANRCLREFIANASLGRCYLVLEAGDVAGYFILTFGYSFEYGGRDLFLDELYLKPTFRGMGLGQAVMKHIDSFAEDNDVKAVHLEVERNNHQGQKLYLKNGYLSNDRSLLTKKQF